MTDMKLGVHHNHAVELEEASSEMEDTRARNEICVAGPEIRELRSRESTSMILFRNLRWDQDRSLTFLDEAASTLNKTVAGYEKRPNSDTSPLAPVVRACGLWYPDGNVIIHAGSLVFRVFRGILSEQSLVLQALLSPENLNKYDVFDGCPVLPLPLSGRDAILFNTFLKRFRFDFIAVVHRLSCTYEIHALRRKMLIIISSAYPTNLAEFSAAGLHPSYCRDEILLVIRFGREHSVDWILPLAFYRYCLEMTTRTLFYGVDYAGENIVLRTEDQALCHASHNIMCEANIAEVLARYDARLNDAGCTGGQACQESRSREADALLQSLTSVPNLFPSWSPEPDSKLCPTCLEGTLQWHRGQRQAFWDGLPRFFELPDWTVLNELKEAALWKSEK
ncbi:hypothetical protein B0H11DRAFT_2239150 [Mycena galericulata]|nr:hypothetical protein B0H11DRAFT_2239150 [Mycena galericulata]